MMMDYTMMSIIGRCVRKTDHVDKLSKNVILATNLTRSSWFNCRDKCHHYRTIIVSSDTLPRRECRVLIACAVLIIVFDICAVCLVSYLR